MQSGRFEEAAAMLREACAHYPEEAHLTSLLSQVEDHIRARQRQERLARESENLYREGRYAELIALLEGPVKEFPGNSELASRLSSASEQLELSRREGGDSQLYCRLDRTRRSPEFCVRSGRVGSRFGEVARVKSHSSVSANRRLPPSRLGTVSGSAVTKWNRWKRSGATSGSAKR